MPPVVPPKPSSPNKSRISPTSQSDSSIPSSPVVGHKSSVAERARLVGALEGAEERAPATHFVSSARATLSPLPGRKVFNVASTQEEKDSDVEKKDEVQESGIVETSIKASSVIKQFETRKISKIKPDEEVFAADQPNGGQTAEPTPKEPEKVEKVEDKKTTKKKSVDHAGGGSSSRRRASGKEAQLFKTSSSATLAKQSAAKTRKESNEQKLVKTTSSVNVTNKNKTRRASKEAEPAAKTKPTSRKSSEVSVGRKSSDASSIKRSASNASTISVGAKSRENTFVKRSSSRQLLPEIEGGGVEANPLMPADEETSAGAQNDRSIVKTTMVVRLHPGQERKLSGAEDKDEDDDIIDDGKEQ